MIPRNHIRELTSKVKVALIIQQGKILPRWFERLDIPSERVQVKEICSTWSHYAGAAKIINFAVYDGSNTYQLSLNIQEFTWKLLVAEGP